MANSEIIGTLISPISSASLDSAFGSTRGMTLVRGASVWSTNALPANRGVLGSDGTDLVGIGGRFNANVSRTTQSIPDGTSDFTTITYDTTDEINGLSLVSNQISFPAGSAGRYVATATANWASNNTGIRDIVFFLNNAEAPSRVQVNATTGVGTFMVTALIFLAAANDVLDVRALQSSGAGLNITSVLRVAQLIAQ